MVPGYKFDTCHSPGSVKGKNFKMYYSKSLLKFTEPKKTTKKQTPKSYTSIVNAYGICLLLGTLPALNNFSLAKEPILREYCKVRSML